ncbi:nitrite reductase small subunit NirD [Sneathiella glossodoripedis]|uniref:nitrite reductase small subunit NirD n=1 Tax=Sneathiella glossodoripedis TaxID=418853 RepID=UPI000472FD21|nr:nitrite reductase small subunit NirD [Sneathiella glossodoripedis]
MIDGTKSWIEVGSISEIPIRGARCVKIGDLTIALFRTAENKIFAMEDKCPHKNGPLSQGIVHGDCVTCPLHNWIISLETGEAQGADKGSTLTFPTQINDGVISISLLARKEVAA